MHSQGLSMHSGGSPDEAARADPPDQTGPNPGSRPAEGVSPVRKLPFAGRTCRYCRLGSVRMGASAPLRRRPAKASAHDADLRPCGTAFTLREDREVARS